MIETQNGLHKCKTGNEPHVGQIKTFVVEQRTGKNNTPYLYIKNEKEEYGGRPYKVISVKPTGFTDAHQNVSFNLEIEPAAAPLFDPGLPPRKGKIMSNDEIDETYQRIDEARAKGDSFHEPIAPQSPPPRKNGNLFTEYAGHAGRAFAAAWEESKNAMAMIPAKDAEELTAFEWLDLRLRIAQGFAIEINKIIRKERF